MEKFENKVAEDIMFYVYCLIDPRNKQPFYVGKGEGNLVFQHVQDALETSSSSDKLDTIRDIHASGSSVNHVIIRHGLNSEEAFLVESTLIDFCVYFDKSLSNKVLGHHSSDSGIMTAEEVHRKYAAEPLEKLEEGCIIVNINKTYKRAKGSQSYYQAAKGKWKIDAKHIPNLKYVLPEFGGIIVEVFEVDQDGWYEVKDKNGKRRWSFNGKVASSAIQGKYKNRKIIKNKGSSQQSIAYNLQKQK